MRIWHQALIPYLPDKQLLGQHRECCALRGNGWGKKHATVDYVFKYQPILLVKYHGLIMNQMLERDFNVDESWFYTAYRGKNCYQHTPNTLLKGESWQHSDCIYPEHNEAYLQECLDNLLMKGIDLRSYFERSNV